jgi:hypothetical protein
LKALENLRHHAVFQNNIMKNSLLLHLCAAAFIATPVFAQENAELRKRAQELEERARQAKEEGRPEQAKELMDELRKLKQEAHGGDEEQARDKKLGRVKAEIEELHNAGKHEEAERLTKRLEEAMPKSFKEDRKENPDAERRDHVMAAIKHLHGAGLHEQAQHLEQMLHETDVREAHGEAAPEMEKALRQMQEQLQRTVREMQERTERAMKETHAQMEKMSRTIDELREQLARQRGESERRKD